MLKARRCGWVLLVALLGTVMSSPTVSGRPTGVVPPLPPPSGAVVSVSTEAQLQTAVRNLASNTTIVLAPGTYRLSATLSINGTFTNVAIRGGTNHRDDVVLVGPGMTKASHGGAPYGIWTGGNVQGVLVANLTIRDFFNHSIIFNAGTERPHVYNVHLIDAGQQFIKSNPNAAGAGAHDGIVEYSVIEYTSTAPSAYTNGIDVHGGSNWIIRHNLLRNIVAPQGLAGPAVLMWNHSSETLTEGNLFLNCARGIAYGLEATGFDHRGGIIRNNVFFRSSDQRGDVGISVADSPNTQVLNNTVFVSGTYPAPIEYRFPGTRDVLVANNLLDGAIAARDGATATEKNNLAGAPAEWFVDARAGDLHLVKAATAAIDRGFTAKNVTDDWDGEPRTRLRFDIGADEYAGEATSGTARPASTPAPAMLREPAGRTPSTPAPTPPSSTPGGGALVRENDLIYQGAFRLPSGPIGTSSFAYGGTALAFNPDGGSLFLVGHDWHQQVAEIRVPAIRNSTSLAALATAGVLQPFADATDGKLGNVGPNNVKVGGLLPYQGQLYLTAYLYYDGTGGQMLSHFVSGLDLSVKSDARGPYQVGTRGAGFVSGYLGLVPSAWQSALGGPVLNGNCCLGVISRTSYGPAVFTIDPLNLGAKSPVPVNPLVYYPAAHPLLEAGAKGDGWGNTSALFNGTTEVRGVVFPEGTRSVLFFGRQGLGTFCYGPGTSDPNKAGQPADGGVDKYCHDPLDSSKGTHAYPYALYVWAYDANDLAAVKAGQKQPWSVKPYATWKLSLPFASAHLNGAAYDAKTSRIFVSQAFTDGELPVVHVFVVKTP